MSKKMLKRSLALGALMAFAITGQAWAAKVVADGNKVIISSTISDDLIGGQHNQGGNYTSDASPVGEYTLKTTAQTSYNTNLTVNANVNGELLGGTLVGKTGTFENSVQSTKVVINEGATIEENVAGGGKANTQDTSASASNTSNVTGDTNVIVDGGIVTQVISGGGVAKTGRGQDKSFDLTAIANVEGTAKIELNKGSANGGVVGGGLAYYYHGSGDGAMISTANVTATDITISGGDVSNIKYSTDEAIDAAVIGGGLAMLSYYVPPNNNTAITANVTNAKITIDGGTINGNVYAGGAAVGGKTTANVTDAIVTVNGGTVEGNVVLGGFAPEADTYANGTGIANVNTATLNYNGGTIEGNVIVDTVENATINMNSNSFGNIVKLLEDTEAELNTDIEIDVKINAENNAKAIFETGQWNLKEWNGESAKLEVANATLNLTTGITLKEANFGSNSVLNIKGTDFVSTEGKYALNATSGTLTVEQGAKLKIDGVEENVTYNIAKGFGVEATVGENWTIDNNLLTGEWTDTNGLQVTTVAKEADEIASDMGVAGGTADALAGIIAAVNNASATTTTEAQQNVKDFANAIANAPAEQAADAAKAVVKMAEAGGNSATAASIVKNITGVTNDRLSFNCGHSAPHKGGHGVGLLEEGSGADIWVEYVHGKDEVEDMKSTAGATSYEGSYDGIVMGLDFKKVNKFQSGIAFNYGEGDTNSVGTSARTHSDYDFWGIGYYGNIHNDDSNVIFDINYAKTDSDVTNNSIGGLTYEASPETTTWTAGVKVEKLYQNENVQIVPYTGLRYMSIDSDDYATKCGAFNYKMERQDIWLLPLGVSIKQEVTNDNGWTVSPRVDLSYIWAFGDTDSDMEFATAYNNKVTNIGYDVMDDGSFLGLVGIEAHKDQWGFGVSYSYQKGDHSESKKWFVDVNYSF